MNRDNDRSTRKRLNGRTVLMVKPDPDRVREIADAGTMGLRLIIHPGGGKGWGLRYRIGSERRRLALGPVNLNEKEPVADPVIGAPLTLAQARVIAVEAMRKVKLGRDPAAELLVDKAANYEAMAVRFIEKYARPKTKSWADTAYLLGFRLETVEGEERLVTVEDGLAKLWAGRSVSDLTKREITTALDKYGARARANTLFSVLRKFFNWLMETGELEKSPMFGMKRPAKVDARDRVLTDNEVRWFWKACAKLPEPFGAVYRLLLVTGQRRDEAAWMMRAELNAEGTEWVIGGERSKNGQPHLVPLCPLAGELIGSAPRVSKQFVFSTTGHSGISGHGKMKEKLDQLMLEEAQREAKEAGNDPASIVIEPWRIHDLRRTAATNLQRLGFPLDVTAAVLNHREGKASGVTAVYARHDFKAEKRTALEALARRIVEIAEGQERQTEAEVGAEVIPMVRRQG